VQDQLKPRHFLETLAGAHGTARQVSKLKIADEKLGAALAKNTLRLERMGDMLENLYTTEKRLLERRHSETLCICETHPEFKTRDNNGHGSSKNP
jgi:hypothetical protein